MKSVFKSYFYFSRGEKTGIILFISVILILFFIPAYMNYIRKPIIADFAQYNREIKAFESVLQADSMHNNKRNYVPDFERPDRSDRETRLHPVTFDPNILSADKWTAMGLSDKQVKIILNYRNKGGKFFQKEDLRKIYGISESEYDILAPFIVISKPAYRNDIVQGKSPGGKFADFKKTIIELNNADSIDLLEIRGVGPAFAHRILRYRNKLGGFYKKEQLLEVYGMDSTRFIQVSDYCSVKAGAILKINMNTASVADFKKHPYFDYYLAKSIVDYRIIHGPYSSVEQLRYTPLIYNDLYNRISPYLKTE
jgi:competence protein ComEA